MYMIMNHEDVHGWLDNHLLYCCVRQPLISELEETNGTRVTNVAYVWVFTSATTHQQML